MKKQRWRFSKYQEHCQECGKKLDNRNGYHETYGACNSTCYMYLIGMSWSDFI